MVTAGTVVSHQGALVGHRETTGQDGDQTENTAQEVTRHSPPGRAFDNIESHK